LTGYIKRLVSDRGFGFISDAAGSAVFFHRTAVLNNAFDSLNEDDEVTFDPVATSPKGPRAENVQLAQSATASAS
jgi:cold shock protein